RSHFSLSEPSSPVDQQSERSRDSIHWIWLRMGLFRSRSQRRTKVRRNKVEVVRFRIERHGLGAILCLDRVENGELVRRFFVEDMNHAVPGGHEQQTRRGVISV